MQPYEEISWRFGLVCKRLTLANMGALGTCFPFLRPDLFLTAAHCVRHVPLADLEIQTLGLGSARATVTRVELHPEADLAALTIDLPSVHYINPLLLGQRAAFFWGAPVVAFRYSSDITYMGRPGNYVRMDGPTPRFFRGHVQRNGLHVSASGYKYQSLELSFAAPSGLSGGPVFRDGYEEAIALVCENIESSTYLRTITEVVDGQSHFKETVHSMVNYAIAVDLPSVRPWLQAQAESGA